MSWDEFQEITGRAHTEEEEPVAERQPEEVPEPERVLRKKAPV